VGALDAQLSQEAGHLLGQAASARINPGREGRRGTEPREIEGDHVVRR
jgi:hypothetical protein